MKTILITAVVLSFKTGEYKTAYTCQDLNTKSNLIYVTDQKYCKNDTILITFQMPN